jgi:hypothetical protein
MDDVTEAELIAAHARITGVHVTGISKPGMKLILTELVRLDNLRIALMNDAMGSNGRAEDAEQKLLVTQEDLDSAHKCYAQQKLRADDLEAKLAALHERIRDAARGGHIDIRATFPEAFVDSTAAAIMEISGKLGSFSPSEVLEEINK